MFFDISVKDIIDIILVAGFLYYFYKLMKESGSLNVFSGILVFILLWVFVSRVIQMKLLGSIFDQLMSVGVLALIIIFQEEVRRFFKNLGSHRDFRKVANLFSRNEKSAEKVPLLPVVMACMSLAQQKVGALIVVEKNEKLDEYVKTGEIIDATIGQRLIEAIFFKNAPLHDGAIIIQDGRITAAQCILPVSHNVNIPKKLGLRHRSAMGISEKTDAIAIVVSEETGSISVAVNGKFRLGLNAQQLEGILEK
jgi:uncharacterized protein (TIGR00159 family)